VGENSERGERERERERGGSRTTPYKSRRHLARYNPCQEPARVVPILFRFGLAPGQCTGGGGERERERERETGSGIYLKRGEKKKGEGEEGALHPALIYLNRNFSVAGRTQGSKTG